MGAKLNLGMVGYGLNSLVHRIELRLAPKLRGRTELISVFDPSPKIQAKLKAKKKITSADSFEALLDTPGLEALLISSPPQFHADQAVAALEHGLHVYSEVPMALKKEDLARIIAAEEQSGKKYQLGENYCFLREVIYAGYLASSGKIGPTVYAESEYLHDVTYRWREGGWGDENKHRVDAWYSRFDPLAYAHSIGPAQVALGGIEKPEPFTEVASYANDIGGYNGDPVCKPAKAFQVALFQTARGAIAKCANAYIFAREPTRLILQVTGRLGTYECYRIGKKGRLFLADGHMVTKGMIHHRKGKVKNIGWRRLSEAAPPTIGGHHGSNTRIKDDWLTAIEKDTQPLLHARVGANQCIAGIAASESARTGKPVKINDYLME